MKKSGLNRKRHFTFSPGNQTVMYRRLVETKHIIQSFSKSNGPKMNVSSLYTAEISGNIRLWLYKIALKVCPGSVTSPI